MRRLINMKKGTPVFLVALVLVSIALWSSTEAALPPPPPDGGYPGFTTAEGTGALFNLTSGIENTGLGFEALNMNTTGNANTAIGYMGLANNISGTANTATGAVAQQYRQQQHWRRLPSAA